MWSYRLLPLCLAYKWSGSSKMGDTNNKPGWEEVKKGGKWHLMETFVHQRQLETILRVLGQDTGAFSVLFIM